MKKMLLLIIFAAGIGIQLYAQTYVGSNSCMPCHNMYMLLKDITYGKSIQKQAIPINFKEFKTIHRYIRLIQAREYLILLQIPHGAISSMLLVVTDGKPVL
jgi:hypothetical protein